MKKAVLSSILFAMMTLASCSVVGGIFKAGVWVGILAVVAVVVLIIFLISKASKK